MAYYLQNQEFQLILHPDRSAWELNSRLNHKTLLSNVHMSCHYRSGHEHVWALEQWHPASISEPEMVITKQGPARQVTIILTPDRHNQVFQLIFALPENEPLLMWKVQIHNQSTRPVLIDQIELLNIGFINISHAPQGFSLRHSIAQSDKSQRGRIDLSGSQPTRSTKAMTDLSFFSNGWQSWSYSGLYRTNDKYQSTRLGFLRQAMIENSSTSHPKRPGLFRSDMYGVLGDRLSRTGLLLGFLSQKNHFGSLEAYLDPFNPCLRMWASGDSSQLDPGDNIETDWACLSYIHLDAPDPIGPYLESVARQYDLHPLQQDKVSLRGWCSWYYFSDRSFTGTVTPQAIRENTLAAVRLKPDLPIDLIQIDDGFEKSVGDWYEFKPEFSEGIGRLSSEIQQAGMTPGLWLAPFIVHPKSQLYHQHPEWLLRNRLHRPVNAGFCWNAFTTALDLTHPGAMDYCKQVIHTVVHEWGFDYLKLDFLYAAALPGKFHDPHKTRAQVLRSALEAVRESAGSKVTLLGCGCPLGPAIGLVDSMRVGTDTARNWYPSFQGIKTYFDRDFSMPSARYSIHNALTRAPMHKRWWINDPDCLLVRPDSGLTLEEVQSVASVIAMSGGSFFLSDDLPKLSADRLRIAQVLLPLIDKRPYILDWFDQPTPSFIQLDLTGVIGGWSLLAFINWHDQPTSKVLQLSQTYLNPVEKYIAREFWRGRLYQINDGQIVLDEIPAHGVCLLAIRPLHPHHPLYVGSDLHISQGLEVSEWFPGNTELSFCIDRPGQMQGVIELYLPKTPQQITCGNENLPFRLLSDNNYRLEAKINRSCHFTVRF